MAAAGMVMVAVIVGVMLGGGGMYVAMGQWRDRAVGAQRELVAILHAMSIPDPTPEQLAAQTPMTAEELRDILEDEVPLDWTDTEPTAAWTSYEVRPDVARLAPGMPLPFLGPEQQELWRQEWEKADRGQGEASFEEWLGEQMLPDEIPIEDDGYDEMDGAAPWVEPRTI